MTPDQTFDNLKFERDNAAYCVVGAVRAHIDQVPELKRFLDEYDIADKALQKYVESPEYRNFLMAVRS